MSDSEFHFDHQKHKMEQTSCEAPRACGAQPIKEPGKLLQRFNHHHTSRPTAPFPRRCLWAARARSDTHTGSVYQHLHITIPCLESKLTLVFFQPPGHSRKRPQDEPSARTNKQPKVASKSQAAGSSHAGPSQERKAKISTNIRSRTARFIDREGILKDRACGVTGRTDAFLVTETRLDEDSQFDAIRSVFLWRCSEPPMTRCCGRH
jgi:hypothetical protein